VLNFHVTFTFDLLNSMVSDTKLVTSNAHTNFEHPTIILTWIMDDPIWYLHIYWRKQSIWRSINQFILPHFKIKLQTYIMQWQATRKNRSSTSWWPIINRTILHRC